MKMIRPGKGLAPGIMTENQQVERINSALSPHPSGHPKLIMQHSLREDVKKNGDGILHRIVSVFCTDDAGIRG